MGNETIYQHIERKANEHTEAHRRAVGNHADIYDVKHSYKIGAIEILRDFMNGLTEIIDEEEKENYCSYYFGIQEHHDLLNSLKRIRDRIRNALEEVGMVCIGTLSNENE